MKKITYFFILLLFSCLRESFAQSAELTTFATKLQQIIVPVQTASKNYEPKMNFVAPAGIRYSYDEVDQKGNKTTHAYEFNLADIDSYAVREQTQKDQINVVLAVRNKQKLIKVYKNEVVEGYSEQALFIAKDIENARAISDLIKKAIPSAEKVMATRLKLSGYDAMVSWLTQNVKNVDLGTKSFTQTLTKHEKPGSLNLLQVDKDNKTSTEEILIFNLADINPNSINYKISGNKFAIYMETLREARYISVRKNGEVKPYTNDLLIYTNNVDEARDLKTVIAMAVPLAIEKVKADIPAPATDKDALQRIKTLMAEITSGNKQIGQTIEPQCLCVFTQVEQDPKTTVKHEYRFNFMDINAAATNIDVSGDRVFIDVTINDNKKLIMHTQAEKFDGYVNDVKFFMPDIEKARRAKVAIDKAIEKCKTSYKEPFGADAGSINTWIRNAIRELSLEETTLKQTLEAVEPGKNNKLKYTRTEVNSKGSGVEEVYEFNLADINPLSVEAEVKGKWLYVSMETDFKGKIIKYYKNGKIQPYISRIDFAINDIDNSRNLMSALKKSIKMLKPAN
jgi:hypothetical protein